MRSLQGYCLYNHRFLVDSVLLSTTMGYTIENLPPSDSPLLVLSEQARSKILQH